MSISEIREQLMIYVAEADDRKLEALYTILQSEMHPAAYSLTKEQMQLVEERRTEYKAGKHEQADWKELLQEIRENRKGK